MPKNGKFDDMAEEADQFEGDIYGDTSADEEAAFQRLQNRAAQQNKVVQAEVAIYEKVTEVEKTMDLLFMGGVLHQRMIVTEYTMEMNTGESKLDKTSEKWEKVGTADV